MTVAGALGWLGNNLRWIYERHDALAHLHIGSYASPRITVCNNVQMDFHNPEQIAAAARDVKPPWSIRLLGEAGMSTISVYGPDNAKIAEKLRRLFPEASVNFQESPPPTLIERMLEDRMRMDALLGRMLLEQTAEQQTPAPDSPNEPVE